MGRDNPFAQEAVAHSPELTRILEMPRRVWTAPQVEAITDHVTALLKTPRGTMRLLPVQALALYEIHRTGGLLGPIPVGGGKELVCFLAAVALGAKHPILLMPAHLVKRSEDEMKAYGVHFKIPSNLRIMSYQMLGQANHENALIGSNGTQLHDAFILNESHRIKNRNAAVTRRVVRYMQRFPDAKVVAVSGTLLAKSVLDFAHMAKWAVKPCPIPTDFGTLQEWAAALDEKPSAYGRRNPGALLKLCNEAELREEPTVAARMGFRRRLTETMGVVGSSGEGDVANAQGDPIGLTIRALHYEQDPVVETHFETLREAWETPSGWAFSVAMEVWRHARTLALGLHYLWDPPPPGGPEGPWCTARRAWKKFVREQIKASHHLDSELVVTNAVKKGDLDNTAFNAWRLIQPSYTPVSRSEFHCDSALRKCQTWSEQGPGIIFTDHTFFALELARRTGLRYFGAGGIDKTGLEIEKADPNTCVIASRVANSTGRNIQFWNRALVTSTPHNALENEQMIGRLHRTGQKRDVTYDVLMGCRENYEGWVRSIELARMTRDTLGASQKLLIAKLEGFPTDADMDARGGFKWQKT